MDYVPLPKPTRLWKSRVDFFAPFRIAAAREAAASSSGSGSPVTAVENIAPLYDPSLLQSKLDDEPDLKELNFALAALVDVFPDVQPEVFREMLVSISEESRLQVVTEHLLQKKAKWVQGRYRTPSTTLETSKLTQKRKVSSPSSATEREHGTLEYEDLFRGEGYKKAVKQVFYQEFRNLSHSSIKAVLAEQNFSYTFSRPVLQQVASKSWRFSLTNFWPRRVPSTAAEGHPFIAWNREGSAASSTYPAVRHTGNQELNQELYDLFVAPVIARQRQDQLTADYLKASEINEAEAEEAGALFDCECCYSSVAFEKIATCDEGCHELCLDCIRRTVNEALYGQGWSRAANLQRATVQCFSPTSSDCEGCIPWSFVRHALTQGTDNEDAWRDFQARVTSETLLQSGLPLQRCPFCSYAEINEFPKPRFKHPMAVWAHITTHALPAVQIMFSSMLMALAIFTVPLLFLFALAWMAVRVYPPAGLILDRSLSRVYKRRQGIRFQCQNPSCTKVSCSRCMVAWRDPHACFESEKTSLRTAIEASATAAVKRTCPKCMLSFVKSSGCNKLVCNCGYTMCYICRQEITSKEGYAHFCQHFRPNGGRCPECERCDLYGDEDEEAAIRRAAEAAERAWRDKEGGKEGGDEKATQLMIDALIGEARKEWYDEWLDAAVDAVIV